jgi:hypothetical protein
MASSSSSSVPSSTNSPNLLLCVCVECGARTSDQLYLGYGDAVAAAAAASGDVQSKASIRLTRCRTCDALLDRYLEYDPVLVVVDLILHKSEVYRHLLFNSTSFSPWARRSLRANVAIFFFLMVLFDAHTKWRIDIVTAADAAFPTPPPPSLHAGGLGENSNHACPSAFSSAMSVQYTGVVLSPTGRLLYRDPPATTTTTTISPTADGQSLSNHDRNRNMDPDPGQGDVVVLAQVAADGGASLSSSASRAAVDNSGDDAAVLDDGLDVVVGEGGEQAGFTFVEGAAAAAAVENANTKHAVAPVGRTSAAPPMAAVDLRQLPPALGGGCFNTSAEDAIIERWVDGIQDTESWARGIRLLLLSLAENIVYITSIIISIRLWQITRRRSSCVQRCRNRWNGEKGRGAGNTGTAGAGTAAVSATATVVGNSSSSSSRSHGAKSTLRIASTAKNKGSSEPSGSSSGSVGSNDSTGDATASRRASDDTTTTATNLFQSLRILCGAARDPDASSIPDADDIPLLSITMIVCAIILSSWGKAILIMLMIWDYANDMVHVVNLVVVTSNVAAVQALLEHKGTPHVRVSLVLVLIPFGILTLVRMALAHAMGLTVVYSTEWTPW